MGYYETYCEDCLVAKKYGSYTNCPHLFILRFRTKCIYKHERATKKTGTVSKS